MRDKKKENITRVEITSRGWSRYDRGPPMRRSVYSICFYSIVDFFLVIPQSIKYGVQPARHGPHLMPQVSARERNLLVYPSQFYINVSV
jgi:hypothetical protein